jgi:hypothetical protein
VKEGTQIVRATVIFSFKNRFRACQLRPLLKNQMLPQPFALSRITVVRFRTYHIGLSQEHVGATSPSFT